MWYAACDICKAGEADGGGCCARAATVCQAPCSFHRYALAVIRCFDVVGNEQRHLGAATWGRGGGPAPGVVTAVYLSRQVPQAIYRCHYDVCAGPGRGDCERSSRLRHDLLHAFVLHRCSTCSTT